VMFCSYGVTVTIEVELNKSGKWTPFTLTAGQSKTIALPGGTTHRDARTTSVAVTKPSFAYICTTF
jgi:hypothetical protein